MYTPGGPVDCIQVPPREMFDAHLTFYHSKILARILEKSPAKQSSLGAKLPAGDKVVSDFFADFKNSCIEIYDECVSERQINN
jgi:hypothetical protein